MGWNAAPGGRWFAGSGLVVPGGAKAEDNEGQGLSLLAKPISPEWHGQKVLIAREMGRTRFATSRNLPGLESAGLASPNANPWPQDKRLFKIGRLAKVSSNSL